jgi:membrane-bound serine protease (ClpP class)
MRRLRPLILFALALAALVAGAGGGASQDAGGAPVHVIELSGSVDTVLADWIDGRIGAAEDAGAAAVLIQIDTPGGLASATDDIVGRIRTADVPVAVWVGPSGARAASAGAFIAASARHVLMAPGTNIGSATPVGFDGGDLSDKVVNDAAASIAALAEATGHNPAAYRAMVTDASNLTAQEAVDADVADALADSREAAIAWLDGRPDGTGGTISTAGAPVETDALPWYLEVLQAITNPNLVFLLLIAGMVGLMIEVLSPGGIIPGAAGLIALLLGLAGLSALPFNWIGLALIVLGVGLLFAETQVPGFGALAIAGIVALCLGGVFLFGSGDDGISTSPWIVVPLGIGVGAGAALAARRVVVAQRNRPVTGVEMLIGQDAVAAGAVDADGGQVLLNGERWAARAPAGARYETGTPLRVVRVDPENLIVMVGPRPHKEE